MTLLLMQLVKSISRVYIYSGYYFLIRPRQSFSTCARFLAIRYLLPLCYGPAAIVSPFLLYSAAKWEHGKAVRDAYVERPSIVLVGLFHRDT